MNRRWTASFRGPSLVVAVAAGLSLAGVSCTTVSADSTDGESPTNSLLPSTRSAVFLTRVGDQLTISWQSKIGMVYSIIAKDRTRRESPWTPVEGHTEIPGTGQQITVELRVAADDPRAFNVSVVPAVKVKPGLRR